MKKSPPNIFILGLRRSGTTIFWETLRQDLRYTSFDEPFNPLLADIPKDNLKKTRDEFISLFNEFPIEFKKHYSDINISEEHKESMSDNQVNYIKWLIEKRYPVIIDFTRCNFKIEELVKIDPEAKIVHLSRNWKEFTSSHILRRMNKSDSIFSQFKHKIKENTFWKLKKHCDGYGMQTLYKNLHAEGVIKDSLKYCHEQIASVWAAATTNIEEKGNSNFGSNFSTVLFSDFIEDPEGIIVLLYSKWNIELPPSIFTNVKKLKINNFTKSKKWDLLEQRMFIPSINTNI